MGIRESTNLSRAGGGGGGVSVTMAIAVSGTPTATGIVISRGDPSIGALDSWDLSYKESYASEWISYATGLTSSTQTVADLDPEMKYDFRAVGHVLIDTPASVTSGETGANTAPTTLSARAQIGQSQSIDYMFGGSGNTAAWGGYKDWGLVPSVDGPTRISWALRVKNKTDMTWGTVTFPLLAGGANNASVLGAWVGTGGTDQTPGAGGWQRIQFGGSDTKILPAGTKVIPYGTTPDIVTLAVPCAPNDSVIFRLTFDSTGEISLFDSLNHSSTHDSGMATCWMARADLGSTPTARDTAGSWEFWGSSPIHALFVEGVYGSPVAVSEQFVGDSVINAFRAWQYIPESASRDGWIYQYGLTNDKAVRICNSGNGGFSLIEYCQRLRALLPVYAPWVDVFVIEAWTPNGTPTTISGNAPLKEALEETIAAIQAAGRGFAFIFPSPASLKNELVPAGAEVSLADMIAYCQDRNPELTMDLSLSLADPQDPDNYDAAYSSDWLHQNLAGNVQFSLALKPINESVLTGGIGYAI